MEETAVIIVGFILLAAFGLALIGVPMLFVKLAKQTERLTLAQTQIKALREKMEALSKSQASSPNQFSSTSTSQAAPNSDTAKTEPVPDPLGLFATTPGDFTVDVKNEPNPWRASPKTEPEETSAVEKTASPVAEKQSSAAPTVTPKAIVEPKPAAKPKPAAEPAEPSLWQKLVEKLLAMNVTAQVGAVVLIFGTIFLGKYASDIGLLTLNAKLALMAIASLTTAAVGVVFYQRLQVYGEILQGTGFAGWLVTLFIAHVLNEQFHWLLVLVLGVAAVAGLSYRAWRQNSQALAMVGYLGGFLTPFIAASDVSSLWRLFAYISVLNVGVVLVAARKPWRWLVREAYVGSFVLLGLLMIAETLQRDLSNVAIQLPMASFAIISLMLFSLIAWQWLKTEKLQFTRHLSGILFAVPASTAIALQLLWNDESLNTALSFSLVALWYVGVWFTSRYLHFAAIAILFATAAIPFALSDGLSSVVYALEGAAFVYWGVSYNKRSTFVFGWLVQTASAVFAFRLFQNIEYREALLAWSWLIYGAVVVAGLASAYLIHRKGMPFKQYSLNTQRLALAWSLFFVVYQFGFWLAETYDREWTMLGLTLVLAGLFVIIQSAVIKIKWPALSDFVAPSFSLFLIAALSFLLDYTDQLSLLKIILLGATVLCLAGFRILLAKMQAAKKLAPLKNWDATVTWFGVTFILSVLLAESMPYVSDWDIILASLPWLLICAFIVPLQKILFSANKTRCLSREFSLRILAVIATASLFNLGNFAPLPFWPLLNPLALLAFASAALIYRWHRNQKLIRIGVLIWLGVALTCEINRSLFHYVGIAYHPESWLDSALTQMVWSLVWVSLGGALMITAARIRYCRSHWFAGASLLAVIVLKLFVLDLANVDTLFRIVSFIGVGVLLLVIGYIAPLPKAAEEKGSVL